MSSKKRLAEMAEYMEACALIARNGADIHNGSKELREHADMVTAIASYLSSAVETEAKPARDADHCDYPDCEQHWTYVATEQKKLLSEARAYVLSFASITKHPTAPADAHDLVKRMDVWIKNSPPAVDFRAAPPPETPCSDPGWEWRNGSMYCKGCGVEVHELLRRSAEKASEPQCICATTAEPLRLVDPQCPKHSTRG
jgi:hypothetical protein